MVLVSPDKYFKKMSCTDYASEKFPITSILAHGDHTQILHVMGAGNPKHGGRQDVAKVSNVTSISWNLSEYLTFMGK